MSLALAVGLPLKNNTGLISDLQFLPFENHLLVSSFNKKLLLYDCSRPQEPGLFSELELDSSILKVACTLNNSVYLGMLDGSIKQVDFENMKILGDWILPACATEVNGGVNNLKEIDSGQNTLVWSTFDHELGLLDTRERKPQFRKKFDNKIFKVDTTEKYLTVGMSGRQIEIYDHRNMSRPYQVRESGLKFQINDLKNFPNGEGFALSSLDGRVAMEYFDPSPEIQSKKYAFKCHRTFDQENNIDVVHPVNSLSFNKQNNTLFTAGSDGYLCLWNWEKRKRMRQFPRFSDENGLPESILKTNINTDGLLIAIATGDDAYRRLSSTTSTFTPKQAKLYLKHLHTNDSMQKTHIN